MGSSTGSAAPSFADEYARLAPSLRSWAEWKSRGPLGRVLEADDLVQEVCYHGYRRFATFDRAQGTFRAWLFGVASLVAQELLRKSARALDRGAAAELTAGLLLRRRRR